LSVRPSVRPSVHSVTSRLLTRKTRSLLDRWRLRGRSRSQGAQLNHDLISKLLVGNYIYILCFSDWSVEATNVKFLIDQLDTLMNGRMDDVQAARPRFVTTMKRGFLSSFCGHTLLRTVAARLAESRRLLRCIFHRSESEIFAAANSYLSWQSPNSSRSPRHSYLVTENHLFKKYKGRLKTTVWS
jgi:hypothetical protein